MSCDKTELKNTVYLKKKTRKMKFSCFLCVALISVTLGYPAGHGYRITPKRAVMISSYYNNPLFRRNYDFIPQGSMSAVVTRDTVASNSFTGPQAVYPPIVELPLEENETIEKYTEKVDTLPLAPVEIIPNEEITPIEVPLVEEVAVPEEVSTETIVVKIPRVPKKQAKKKPVKEEEEEEEGLPAYWPFAAGKGSVPSYSAFFPINISGSTPARSRAEGEEDHYPGSGIAIANSFSTGKGGIATSHATSFGDPYLAALVRNALLNTRTKKPQEV